MALAALLNAQPVPEEGLKEVRFSELSSQSLNPLGVSALALNRDGWKHAETENFIYHFFDLATARQVASEAEFYFRVIARDLGKEGTAVERKAHIFILPVTEWNEFKRGAQLDPWTGGLHAGNELFITRGGERFGGSTLGHEVAHLVVERFFGSHIPLWLNEGYAEYISGVLYAAYYRARGYASKPRYAEIKADEYIPLEKLVAFTSYPPTERESVAFYVESRKLVTFLQQRGKESFRAFFEAMAKGSYFESAVDGAYGGRFVSRRELEDQFRAEAFKQP
ncbi:hypothetical protein AYO41_01445 [Verrucomicrobia bacterium SCGC AG-212-E04]|nr:hypothetical protein AYO41_01445 [Verrucomicrobia bacterium SCGC AG-212-E04]